MSDPKIAVLLTKPNEFAEAVHWTSLGKANEFDDIHIGVCKGW